MTKQKAPLDLAPFVVEARRMKAEGASIAEIARKVQISELLAKYVCDPYLR